MKNAENFIEQLLFLAPGTSLREGLENILRAKTGAIIVLSDSPQIMEMAEGGFVIDCEFTPTALYELAKMDGAIILDKDATKILMANVHLMPQASIPSQERGIRHRIADKVSKKTGEIVIAISERRNIISLYKGSKKYVVRDTAFILSKANQAIQTLDKYKNVLDKTLNKLSILEFEDLATVYDVAKVVERLEMVLLITTEINQYIYQLGTEGRLISMQLDELTQGIEEERMLLLKDYAVYGERTIEQISVLLMQCADEEKLGLAVISKILGFGGNLSSLDVDVTPRGYRLLSKIPKLPLQIIENLVERFERLPAIILAKVEELDEVEGIGEVRANAIKEGLQKLREQLLLDPGF